MAVLGTGNITLPTNIAQGLFSKAQTGSAVAALSGQTPQQFGSTTVVTLNGRPRAEYVGEGADKSSSSITFGTKQISPRKVQYTMRTSEEVLWADEDYQLGILTALADNGAEALARALDLGVFHGINPLSGSATTLIPVGDRIATTTNQVEQTTATAATPDLDIEAAVGLVIADGYTPTGVALDAAFAFKLATARYTDGRKRFPELGFGTGISGYEGLQAYTTSTVSGAPEATNQNVLAIVGQWDALRWGVQRSVPVEIIKFGDPDGQGDLKRKNQVALRLEVVYGWGVMDLDAFGLVVNKVANV